MKQSKSTKRKLDRKKTMAMLFLVMLGVICLVNLFSKDKEYSEKENRMLQQKPEISLYGIESGRWMKEYESYRSDQFVGRNFWVSLKTKVLAGKRESNGVFKGKDSYLLEDIKEPDQEQLSQNLEAIKEFESGYQNVPFYVMLVPNAANVLSDKLPPFAVVEDQKQIFDDIQNELDEYIHLVDVSQILKKHKSEVIYYHTDHHWTTLGAYYAFQELAASMELDISKISTMKPYAVTNDFNGTLSATSGYETGYEEPIYIYASEQTEDMPEVVVNYVNEKKKTATLYDTSKLEEKDKYAVFLGGNYPLIDIRTTADTTDRLLLIKDSYANCMIPFLTPYFREIVVVDPRYYYGDIKELMEENDFTSVLFLYNGNTFVEDNSISGVLQNDKTE